MNVYAVPRPTAAGHEIDLVRSNAPALAVCVHREEEALTLEEPPDDGAEDEQPELAPHAD